MRALPTGLLSDVESLGPGRIYLTQVESPRLHDSIRYGCSQKKTGGTSSSSRLPSPAFSNLLQPSLPSPAFYLLQPSSTFSTFCTFSSLLPSPAFFNLLYLLYLLQPSTFSGLLQPSSTFSTLLVARAMLSRVHLLLWLLHVAMDALVLVALVVLVVLVVPVVCKNSSFGKNA